MKPLPDDLALTDHQGSNHWIWACRSLALRRQAESHGHEVEILLSTGHRFLRREVVGLLTTRAFFAAGFELVVAIAACAADNRAIATRKGEQLT